MNDKLDAPHPKRRKTRQGSQSKQCVDLSNILRPFSSTSTIDALELEIGNFFIDSGSYKITSKFYHTKKQFVWELKHLFSDQLLKIVIEYSDIDTLIFSTRTALGIDNRIVQMSLTTNTPAKLFKCEHNESYKHNKFWVKTEDFTYGCATKSLQLHRLLFTQSTLLEKQGILSHFEKLLLGDPYLMHISYLDGDFPAVGKDVSIIGRRSWTQILSKLESFLLLLEMQYSLLSDFINHTVMHKFKWRQNANPEPAIALNIEGIFSILEAQENLDIISKDEIQYVTSVGKLGENGISMFQGDDPKPVRVAVLLSKERLIRLCGKSISSVWSTIHHIPLK